SSRRRHTRFSRDWSSDVCSSDLFPFAPQPALANRFQPPRHSWRLRSAALTRRIAARGRDRADQAFVEPSPQQGDRQGRYFGGGPVLREPFAQDRERTGVASADIERQLFHRIDRAKPRGAVVIAPE